MSKANVDVLCKVLLNFLLWAMIASFFYFSRGFDAPWNGDISGMFEGGIAYFPAVATVVAAVALMGVVLFVAKKLRAPKSHTNELFGDLIDEMGSVVASFGSVLFFVAAQDIFLRVSSLALLVLGGLLFRLAIRVGA